MTTHGDHPRTDAQTRADELRELAGPVESGAEPLAGADAPDARTDPDVDEVREGGEGPLGDTEEYGLRSMPAAPNPRPGDPASEMNF